MVSEPESGSDPSGLSPGSEATLQGSWRESGSAPADPDSDCAENKFSEPVAVSSAPPTDASASAYVALRWSLDLIPLRARCKGEGRADWAGGQGRSRAAARKLRPFLYTTACFAH